MSEYSEKRGGKKNVSLFLLFVFILYCGLHVLSRTEGIRSLLTEKISEYTQQSVVLKKCTTTPLFGLHLRGLEFRGVEIADVYIRFNWLAGLFDNKPWIRALKASGATINFQQTQDGTFWESHMFQNLGSQLGVALGVNAISNKVEHLLPSFPSHVMNEKTSLQLSRVKVAWLDKQYNELGYIADARVRINPRDFINRHIWQVLVSCGDVKLATGALLRDLNVETIKIKNYKAVTVLKIADSHEEYEGFESQALWQDLHFHLQELSSNL